MSTKTMKTTTKATVALAGDATRPETGAYTPAFLEAALCGGGAWAREARLVVALAARRGVKVDEQALLYSDVHDLQALRMALADAA